MWHCPSYYSRLWQQEFWHGIFPQAARYQYACLSLSLHRSHVLQIFSSEVFPLHIDSAPVLSGWACAYLCLHASSFLPGTSKGLQSAAVLSTVHILAAYIPVWLQEPLKCWGSSNLPFFLQCFQWEEPACWPVIPTLTRLTDSTAEVWWLLVA